MHDVLTARSPNGVALAWATGVADSSAAFSGFLWLGTVVLSIMALVVVLATLRRRFRDATVGTMPPFSLADLRRLKEAGTVSAEEYDALRHSAIMGMDAAGGAKT